jgi:diguanylate cyclase (GGDEF)-like protein/PAS domain S-box-containing protein
MKCPSLPLICSVRGRIIVGFGLLVIILATFAAGSIWLTRQHHSHLTEMEEHADTTALLQEAKLSGSITLTVLQSYLLTGDETTIPEIRAYLAIAEDSITAASATEETWGDEEEIAAFNQLAAGAAFLTETSEQVITLRQSGDVQSATAALEATLPALQQVGLEIDRVTEFERQEVAALRSQADTTGGLAFWFAVIAGGGGAVLALAASVLIARSILKPLRSLESAALAVASGDLEARARPSGPRELANLATSLNQMTESLLDASQRREIMEALRQSEQRFRAAFESSALGTGIVALDGHFQQVNQTWCDMLGYSQEEMTARTFTEVTHPDDVEQSQATARSLTAGETSGITLEKRYLHKAGHVVWAIVSASVVRDAQGNALYMVSQLQDITDRKRAEEALRESEERWRSLVENAPSFISTIDRDGTVLSINRTLPGLTPEQMIGTSVYDYTHPEYRSQARECYERVFQTGEAGSLETAGIRGDGDPFWYVSLVGPIENDGQIVALTIITTDVTDRKRAEEELQRLNRRLEEINASLEERVRERTEELRLANEELQQRNRQLLDARAQAATDSVTGISNHRTFQERIRDEVSRAEINATTVGLIMLDIDGFKAVNDSQGHLSGDEILRQLASTIEDVVGRERAYRYGGDEFAVLLPLTDRRDTARMAERLRQAAERQNNGDGNVITLSLGVASFPEAAGSAEELIYGADAAGRSTPSEHWLPPWWPRTRRPAPMWSGVPGTPSCWRKSWASRKRKHRPCG